MKLIGGLTLFTLLAGVGLSQPYVDSPSYFGLTRVGDWKYLNYNGEAVLTDYYGSGPDLVIPSSINGIPVKWVGGGAYSLTQNVLSADNYEIKNVFVADGIVEIQPGAFHFFKALTNVGLSSSITNINNAFYSCGSLKSINISTNIKTLTGNTFGFCASLTNINLPQNLESIGGGTFYQSGLVSIDIPNSVTNIGPTTFKDCSNLVAVKLPSNLSTVSFKLFENCTNLVSVTMPTNTQTISGYAFYLCSKLNDILIPSTVTTIGEYAFVGTTALRNVSLPDSLQVIKQGAFVGSGVTNVQLGNNLEIIESLAFAYCQSLSLINIPNTITNLSGDTFNGCVTLTNIYLPGDAPAFSASIFPSNATIYYQTNQLGWSSYNFGGRKQNTLNPVFSGLLVHSTNNSTRLKLKMNTVRGLTYTIQKTTNLFNWQNLISVSGNNSEQEYEETLQDKAFYRIRQN